jgi:hypothetical protein
MYREYKVLHVIIFRSCHASTVPIVIYFWVASRALENKTEFHEFIGRTEGKNRFRNFFLRRTFLNYLDQEVKEFSGTRTST